MPTLAPLLDPATMNLHTIDPKWMISRHFSYKEALWLNKWNRMGNPDDGLTVEILHRLQWFFLHKMDDVRDLVGPIDTHICWRPFKYNALIGGAPHSAHRAEVDALGNLLKPGDNVAGLDFHVVGFEGGKGCDQMREKLAPELKARGIRMERRPGSDWIHIDSALVLPGHSEYFWP